MDNNKRIWLFGGAGLLLLACCVLAAIGAAVYFLLRGEGNVGLPTARSPFSNNPLTPRGRTVNGVFVIMPGR